jgi:hypothetical protein
MPAKTLAAALRDHIKKIGFPEEFKVSTHAFPSDGRTKYSYTIVVSDSDFPTEPQLNSWMDHMGRWYEAEHSKTRDGIIRGQ